MKSQFDDKIEMAMDEIKKRNSGEQLPPLTELLDQAYNTAIYHAIEKLKIECDFLSPETPSFFLIKTTLEKLIKPSQPTETQK